MNRRECLTSLAAAAAGSAFLSEAIGQEKNPAAQVADKTSALKITALRTYWVNPVVFVKIETDQAGLVGWGEASLEWKTRAGVGCVEDFAPFVIGEDLMSFLITRNGVTAEPYSATRRQQEPE